MRAFGAKVLAYDVVEDPELVRSGINYVTLDKLYAQSDFISLHVPLIPETTHLINDEAIQKMKNGVYLINISRGAVIDTRALIRGLRQNKFSGVALDVYDNDRNVFYNDCSN
jgi:D-lactate dehydrogenase